MTDWNWWHRLSKDEQLALANAEYHARRYREMSMNAKAEAEWIIAKGRAKVA